MNDRLSQLSWILDFDQASEYYGWLKAKFFAKL